VFTGIVRELGTVTALTGDADGIQIRLFAEAAAASAELGDSIALNGVCLTVAQLDGKEVAFDAVPETIDRTSLSTLEQGSLVNVEPALRAGDAMGGHVVQGHVDATGRITSLKSEGEGHRLSVELPDSLTRYCVEKGSIAVEGVSLTIARISGVTIEIVLVPHTFAATTLGSISAGSEVNLEVDVLAKYVEKLLQRDGDAPEQG